MRIQYISSSIFESRLQTLVNPVNTVGVMGKGLAAEFKHRYPEMFKRYKEHCEAGALTIGKLHLYQARWRLILNFPTKKYWKDPSELEWIEIGLKKLAAIYEEKGIISLAMPQLGCGNGGLGWEDVQPLIERYMEPLPIPIHVHTVQRRQ